MNTDYLSEFEMGIAERKQSEKDARIRLILNSAATIFRKKGFRDATVENIADHAQISKGTIYLYFKSKSDLYFCLVQPALENLSKHLMTIVEDKFDSAENKMHRFARAVYDFYNQNKDAYYLISRYSDEEYFKLLPKDRLDGFKNLMRGSLKQAEIVIQEGIDKGVFKDINPYAGAVIFWSAFIGMMQFQENRLAQGKKDHREASLGYLDIIVDGLRK